MAGGVRRVDGGVGELAGLPEQDELFQAGEQAREAGRDEGVQGRGQPGLRLVGLGGGAQTGELVGQGLGF